MRRLVICADGTWNTPDKTAHGTPVPTNVTKMARAVCSTGDDGVSQIVFYHEGVGTGFGLLDKVLGGGFGVGLERNICDCYRFLVDNYEHEDEIYLFGFSRGAFTARSLGGMIRKCGVLKPNETHRIPEAFNFYRSGVHPDDDEAVQFRERYSIPVRIKMIGVWDTVGSLGIPGAMRFIARKRFEFHDVALSSTVDYAFHALSIDEQRKPFEPTLWGIKAGSHLEDRRHFEQVWFCGVHSNVGGGYPDAGLSDIAFEWMVEKAKSTGLQFDSEFVQSRVKGSFEGEIVDSLGHWKVLGKLEREIGNKVLDKQKNELASNQAIHPSVYQRLSAPLDPRYDPPNLRKFLDRNPPPPPA
ncbi:DUF2235 domain-containing protein [Longimicrobium sp.]|uniref:DUF2235 domain-containing protein n=1 Tax=Longimicrobium sp. TaxID=2029185 RepID=UPI002C110611|nr:DUF2235 domain-containing protein [Longimicrobium sp.]HSU16280.1 DUF2235 domain-containing protein [Longimicrobium sp.]